MAQVPTTVHNIIVGKLWADQHGTMVITNHVTGDKCDLKYHAYSYFASIEVCRTASSSGIHQGVVCAAPQRGCHGDRCVWSSSLQVAWLVHTV